MGERNRPERTIREALVMQALEDLDDLVGRIERLPEKTALHEAKALAIATALSEAADKYMDASRMATKELMTTVLQNVNRQSISAVESAGSHATSSMSKALDDALKSVRDVLNTERSAGGAEAAAIERMQKKQDRWNLAFAVCLAVLLLLAIFR